MRRIGQWLGGWLVALMASVAVAADAPAPAINWDLDEAISQIDRQADDFKTAMAGLEVTRVNAEGVASEPNTGQAYFRSDGRIRFTVAGGERIILLDSSRVHSYDSAAGKVDEYRLSRNKDRLEPFARLGFSTTGRDLKDDYLITILGEETVGSARTLVLELTPKRDRTRESVRLVRLWIDQASWMPLRQEFSATADGSRTVLSYSSMARNLKLNPDLFKADWPRGTEEIRH